MQNSFILIALFFLTQNAIGATSAILKDRLQFPVGPFQLKSGSPETCLGDVLTLDWVGDESNVTLAFGPKYVFSHLESETTSSPSINNCQVTTKTTVQKMAIHQTTTYKCPAKKDNFKSTQDLQLQGKVLAFRSQDSKNAKTKLNCEYEEIQK